MTPAPLHVGQAPFRVGAEQRRLHAVGLRERLADRLEQARVRRRVAAPRALDGALVDHHHTVAAGHRAVDQRALARTCDTGDDAKHAERNVDVDVLEVVRRGATHLERAGRRTHRVLDRGPVVEVAAGDGVTPPQPFHASLEADAAALGACAGAEVDDVVSDGDGLRLVLDDEHGVALVAQLQQQLVHPLDVVRVQADRRLVKDVGDVREGGAQVPDHLGALGLAAGQGARRPVQREVAQPDFGERVEQVLQAL